MNIFRRKPKPVYIVNFSDIFPFRHIKGEHMFVHHEKKFTNVHNGFEVFYKEPFYRRSFLHSPIIIDD